MNPNNTIQQDIESIVSNYKGRNLITRTGGKREQYQNEWKPSPMAKPKHEEVEKVDFTYEIMRVALHYTVTNSKILQRKGKQFTINNDNIQRLTKLLKSITGDIAPYICRVTKKTVQGYNPYKGVFMFGPPSSGKTFIMKSISKVLNNAYYTGWYTLESPTSFYYYKELILLAKQKGNTAFLKEIFNDKKIIFIDDLGYKNESTINLYGREDIFSMLVDILYRKYLEGAIIHISCNLTLEIINDQFGPETHDRILDMCTPVSWMGDNFRI